MRQQPEPLFRRVTPHTRLDIAETEDRLAAEPRLPIQDVEAPPAEEQTLEVQATAVMPPLPAFLPVDETRPTLNAANASFDGLESIERASTGLSAPGDHAQDVHHRNVTQIAHILNFQEQAQPQQGEEELSCREKYTPEGLARMHQYNAFMIERSLYNSGLGGCITDHPDLLQTTEYATTTGELVACLPASLAFMSGYADARDDTGPRCAATKATVASGLPAAGRAGGVYALSSLLCTPFDASASTLLCFLADMAFSRAGFHFGTQTGQATRQQPYLRAAPPPVVMMGDTEEQSHNPLSLEQVRALAPTVPESRDASATHVRQWADHVQREASLASITDGIESVEGVSQRPDSPTRSNWSGYVSRSAGTPVYSSQPSGHATWAETTSISEDQHSMVHSL